MSARKGRRDTPAAPKPAPAAATRPASRLAPALAALVLAGALAAWLGLRPERHSATIARDGSLSVLLISIDTLRADALAAYGHPRARTPWIDRLAREGVRFETAYAHNVVTLPSHANILSGRYPFEHGVRDNSGFRFPAEMPTLATVLHDRGYATGAFVSAFPLDSRFGLERGFDVYDDRLGSSETRTAFLIPERRGAQTIALARAWLQAQSGKRSFAFLHLYEPHFPYEPAEPYRSRFPDEPYLGEVEAADAALEPVLRPLFDAGAASRTLVVLTADHGESLGEHGESTHGVFAYDATLRVPLVLWAPGILRPGVVKTPARHVDILPSVLDALGSEIPAGVPGRSLLAPAAGAPGEAPSSYFEALSASLDRGWAPLRGVVRGGLKYVDLPIPELYELSADPQEGRNLFAARAAEAGLLHALLERMRERERTSERVLEDAAAAEKLRALGYVSGAAPARESYGPQDDPKSLIAFEQREREMLELFRSGRIDDAIALGRKLVAEREGMAATWLQLAYLERTRGSLDAAIGAARRALALRPQDAETLALNAVYENERGRPAEALRLVEPAIRAGTTEPDVLTAGGMALAALGRREEALQAFGRVRQADPSNAMALVNAATVHLLGNDLQRAREAFVAALEIDPGLARAENGLGVIALRMGQPQEAAERWKRAAALDPADYQTLFNLGSLLRDAGRGQEARPYLEAYLRAAPPALEARDIARVRGWLQERPKGLP